ncbi:MAG: hypothetical protein EHM70_06980 [Chloroflexota bacterium]|nr:MAG: hypothetical protein EHM70_06980 [Chloroflexota bacterium]
MNHPAHISGASARGSAASCSRLAIYRLNAEIEALEGERRQLLFSWPPFGAIRWLGLACITAGMVILISQAIYPPFGVTSIAAGILLHGSTMLLGKEYFARQAYLRELIELKRLELAKWNMQD